LKMNTNVYLTLLTTIILQSFSFAELVEVELKAVYSRKVGSLYIRGNGCGLNWNSGTLMKNVDDITWAVQLICPITETNTTVELKVLINDQVWMLGSNHHYKPSSKTNLDSVLYPWFYNKHGSLQIVNNIYSPELGNSRNIIYYFPPSYTENTLKPYSNIIIMHDGQNLFDPSTSAFGTAWMCQDTLDATIISGTTDEVVIIGAYNTADRTNEYTYIYDPSESAGGKGDLYLDWIESTLIPTSVKLFNRLNFNRDSLGIVGSSLGGLISCYAGMTRPSVYGKVGCMSTSLWWDSQDFQLQLLPSPQAIANNETSMVYIDAGTSGSLGGEAQCAVYSQQVFEYLQKEKGFVANESVYLYIDVGGHHNEASWGNRFHIVMETLYSSKTV